MKECLKSILVKSSLLAAYDINSKDKFKPPKIEIFYF